MIRKLIIIMLVILMIGAGYARYRQFFWKKLPIDLGPTLGCLICECKADNPSRVKIDAVLDREMVEFWCWVGQNAPSQRFDFRLIWVIIICAVYPCWSLLRFLVIRRRRMCTGRCRRCGYLLTGNESGICPECGRQIESSEQRASLESSDSDQVGGSLES
jgi:hypothetical protein